MCEKLIHRIESQNLLGESSLNFKGKCKHACKQFFSKILLHDKSSEIGLYLEQFILPLCLKINITSATFMSSRNSSFLTHRLSRLQIIGEMIGQASFINLMSMSSDKVAFLNFECFYYCFDFF